MAETSDIGSVDTPNAVNPAHVHLFLTTELFHPDLPGGLMRFFRYGPGLVERGIRPHVITLRHRPGLATEEQVNGIRIHRLDCPSAAPGDEQRPWLLRRALQQALAIRRDGGLAVLQPAMLSHTMAPTLLQARLNGVPVIHNLSLAPETALKTSLHGRLRQWLRMAVMCAPVSRFVFLSHQLQRQYQKRWPLRPSQVEIIPNGVDLERFQPAVDEIERHNLRAKHGLGDAAKVVLFVGGVMERKGVDILLEAWNTVTSHHPRAVLVVVGSDASRVSHQRPGYQEKLVTYLEQLNGLRSRLEKPESVRFVGERDDPAPFYRLADLFAFPSRREGLPNAVLEAMASGLPCLVARFDGMPHDGEELGYEGRHHLSLSHKPSEWAEALCNWLDPRQLEARQSLAHEARLWIKTIHPLPRILDTWAHLYHTCHSPQRL